MSNYLTLRQHRSRISSDIPEQFPDIYRLDSPVFVDFVKAYYEAVEEFDNFSFREAKVIRDIDSTFERFLSHYRDKYLRDFPTVDPDDTRFIIKHIQDLYRRKGTEESIRLIFRLFFQEEIEVYYPGKNIFKSSDSVYRSSLYLEMNPVSSPDNYPISAGQYIVGDTSKARAYVDEVTFRQFQGVIVPIINISNMIGGSFVKDDDISIESFDGTRTTVGRIMSGSISDITIKPGNKSDDNKEGDEYEIISEFGGVVGKAVATAIEEQSTGSIDFTVSDGGYGYSFIDNRSKADLFQGTATLAANAVRGDTRISLGNSSFEIKDTRSLRYSVKFVTPNTPFNQEVFYEIAEVPVGQSGLDYDIILARPLDFDITTIDANGNPNVSVEFYFRAEVPEIVTSNQVLVVDESIGEITEGEGIILPEDLELRLSDKLTVVGAAEPQDAFSESTSIISFLDKLTVSGSAETIIKENNLIYIKATDEPFKFAVNEEDITDYTFHTSINGVPASFIYEVGDFVRYQSVVYECVQAHKPTPVLNTTYFRLPVLDRIPENSRIALEVERNIDGVDTVLGRFYVKTMSPYNSSAGFRVSALKDSENLKVIDDRLNNVGGSSNAYKTLPINAADYKLSGPGAEGDRGVINQNTPLNLAFEFIDLTLGEVASVEVLNNGDAYENDVKSVVRQNYVRAYDKKDLIIKFDESVTLLNTTKFDVFNPPDQESNRVLTLRSVADDVVTLVIDEVEVKIYTETSQDLESATNDIVDQINEQLKPVNKLATIQNGDIVIGSYDSNVVILPQNVFDEDEQVTQGNFSDYFILVPGEEIQQIIAINDIAFQSSPSKSIDEETGEIIKEGGYLVRLEYIKQINGEYYFRQKSYYGPDLSKTLHQENTPNALLTVEAANKDESSNAMGNNALIDGSVYFSRGQLSAVRIVGSGYRYRDGEIVTLKHTRTGEIAARAKITVSGVGFSEGEWKTANSFTSSTTGISRLHDNDYYQEYSYEISSIVNPEKYGKLISDVTQPAGTKQFTTPLINSTDKVGPTMDGSIEIYDISIKRLAANNNGDTIGVVGENDQIVGELVAVVASIDEDVSRVI